MVNGVKFHIRDLDNRHVTQNSGVCTKGDHEGEMHDFLWSYVQNLGIKVCVLP